MGASVGWLELLNTIGLIILGVLTAYNRKQVGDVHQLVNSRMTELLSLTKTASKAEGVKEASDAAGKRDADK